MWANCGTTVMLIAILKNLILCLSIHVILDYSVIVPCIKLTNRGLIAQVHNYIDFLI